MSSPPAMDLHVQAGMSMDMDSLSRQIQAGSNSQDVSDMAKEVSSRAAMEDAHEKKKRKAAQYPSPPWKDNDWAFTKKMLRIMLDPAHDSLRRNLWPRMGEITVSGNRIEYQTALAKLSLEGWSEEHRVHEDPRWYGARVKDWMHKLPKLLIDSEKLLTEAADTFGLDFPVGGWQPSSNLIDATLSKKCPVFRELQQLLGGPVVSRHSPSLTNGIPIDPNIQPNLEVEPIVNYTKTYARAQIMERKYPLGPPPVFSGDWTHVPEASTSNLGSLKRPRSTLSSSEDDEIESDAKQARKMRQLELKYERIRRQDEMAHEREMEEIKEREGQRERKGRESKNRPSPQEREFLLEQLRLQNLLVQTQVQAGIQSGIHASLQQSLPDFHPGAMGIGIGDDQDQDELEGEEQDQEQDQEGDGEGLGDEMDETQEGEGEGDDDLNVGLDVDEGALLGEGEEFTEPDPEGEGEVEGEEELMIDAEIEGDVDVDIDLDVDRAADEAQQIAALDRWSESGVRGFV